MKKNKLLALVISTLIVLGVTSCTKSEQKNIVLSGDSFPVLALGMENDVYFNTSTFELYKKIDGKWVVIGNLKGSNGSDGVNGSNGVDGKDGANGQNGKDGANGQDGQDGKDGVSGDTGVVGVNGKDATNFLVGEGMPKVSDGKIGDVWFDSTTYYIYIKEATGWNKIGGLSLLNYASSILGENEYTKFIDGVCYFTKESSFIIGDQIITEKNILGVVPGFPVFTAGSGTELDPLVIKSPEELLSVSTIDKHVANFFDSDLYFMIDYDSPLVVIGDFSKDSNFNFIVPENRILKISGADGDMCYSSFINYGTIEIYGKWETTYTSKIISLGTIRVTLGSYFYNGGTTYICGIFENNGLTTNQNKMFLGYDSTLIQNSNSSIEMMSAFSATSDLVVLKKLVDSSGNKTYSGIINGNIRNLIYEQYFQSSDKHTIDFFVNEHDALYDLNSFKLNGVACTTTISDEVDINGQKIKKYSINCPTHDVEIAYTKFDFIYNSINCVNVEFDPTDPYLLDKNELYRGLTKNITVYKNSSDKIYKFDINLDDPLINNYDTLNTFFYKSGSYNNNVYTIELTEDNYCDTIEEFKSRGFYFEISTFKKCFLKIRIDQKTNVILG